MWLLITSMLLAKARAERPLVLLWLGGLNLMRTSTSSTQMVRLLGIRVLQGEEVLFAITIGSGSLVSLKQLVLQVMLKQSYGPLEIGCKHALT